MLHIVISNTLTFYTWKGVTVIFWSHVGGVRVDRGSTDS